MRYNELEALRGRIRMTHRRAYSVVLKLREALEKLEDTIEGLCPNKCSCLQCRQARMNSVERQCLLQKIGDFEAIKRSGAVFSDLESRAIGHEETKAVTTRWSTEQNIIVQTLRDQYPEENI